MKTVTVYTIRAADYSPVFETKDSKECQFVFASLCNGQAACGEEPTYFVTIGTLLLQ